MKTMTDRNTPETILIVDDIPANLTLMVEYLAEAGFQAIVARTGEVGLHLAHQEHPHLILLDVMLPGLDGFEICRRLKSDGQTRDIPVIFMTVATRAEDKITGFAVGGVDYVTKPFQPKELLARVTTHLTLARLQQELQAVNAGLEQQVAARTAELQAANAQLQCELAERKQAEEKLRMSEHRLNEAQHLAHIGSWELNLINNVLIWSDEIFRIFEIDPAQFGATYEAFLNAIHPDDRETVNFAYTNSLKTRTPYAIDHRLLFSDGRIKYVHEQCETFYDGDQPIRSIGTVQNITERKWAEEALRRLNRELRALSTCNQVLIRAEDEQTLLNDICRIICDEAGYRLAWVGYAEHDDARTVRPVAWGGFDGAYVANASVRWADDTDRGRGPGGTAIRSGAIVYIQDFTTDPRMAPWRESALQRGYRSVIGLPLKDEHANVFGVLLIYSTEINAFTPDELRLLEELAGDLAFGIVALRTRAERQRAEETLRQSEELLRVTLTNILDPVFITDNDGKLTFICPNVLSILGYAMEEVRALGNISKLLGDGLFNPEELEMRGEIINIERLIVDNAGRQRVFLVNVRRVSIAEGTRLYALHDITERKRAEEVLQDQYATLRSIIDSANALIFSVDRQYRYTSFNTGHAAVMHALYGAEIEIGHSLLEYMSVTEDRETARSNLDRAFAGEQIVEEFYSAEALRSRQYFQVSHSPITTTTGEVIGVAVLAQDMTARKRAEAEIRKLSQAVEQSPAAIVITDPVGTIQYVNPRFTGMTGYTRDEALGKNPRILKSGETSLEEYQQLWNTITHGGVWRGEFHNKKKNNDLYWEAVSISPVMDSQGNITNFVAVKEDITARKRAEEALRILNEELELRVQQRTAELETANKELQEFAHIVSHDLKAPLRGIARLTQWLQADYASVLDVQGQEQLDLLGEQVKRMDNLIDGILRYSRAGYRSEREELIDLHTLVPQVIEMLMPPAHIAIRVEEPLPVIHGDPVQITQLFQNLLSNAVKFMDKPAGVITIASEDASEAWIFRVDDNGPGIEPRHHERIFKIFQSITARNDRESTGIGLAVVKKIVEFYGGRVWVESVPGQGSRFYFTWPKRNTQEGLISNCGRGLWSADNP